MKTYEINEKVSFIALWDKNCLESLAITNEERKLVEEFGNNIVKREGTVYAIENNKGSTEYYVKDSIKGFLCAPLVIEKERVNKHLQDSSVNPLHVY